MPKPEWWNDEALKALSAQVVAFAPGTSHACSMRAHMLSGDALFKVPWNAAGPRTAAEIKEAATWFRRSARAALAPGETLFCEDCARHCDAVADPLLAKEEAEEAAALRAAEIKVAKAREAAEAKATAAAEELLAEEEKDKEQSAKKKAGQAKGKGKKGKGKRS